MMAAGQPVQLTPDHASSPGVRMSSQVSTNPLLKESLPPIYSTTIEALPQEGLFSTKETMNDSSAENSIVDLTTYKNLWDLLIHRAEEHADACLTFYDTGCLPAPAHQLSYAELVVKAKRIASKLLQLNVRPGSTILLHFDNHHDNVLYFWGVTCAGFIPAMSTAFSNNIDQRRAHLLHLWKTLDRPLCLTRNRLLAEFSCQQSLELQAVEELGYDSSVESENNNEHILTKYGLFCFITQGVFKTNSDLAALMLTSGSTGHAKAVSLTHGQILKSIAGKATALHTNSNTPFLNWIGMDHVAALVEVHGHALWTGASQVFAPAIDIISDPMALLRLISRHKVANTFAPNFFLASLLRTLSASTVAKKDLDLSTFRTLVSGGEANVVDTGRALCQILKGLGAESFCIKPAFGMTETCGGCIYSDVFPKHDLDHQYDFASVGKCIDGIEIRIVNDDGIALTSKLAATPIGNLEMKGPIVFKSYFNNDEATVNSFCSDGWFQTGDYGLIDSAGQLLLTGRAKELLIINGVNHSPSAIEATLETVDGTVPSYTLVLPYRPPGASTESLCVVYDPAYSVHDTESRVATNNAISSVVLLQVGIRPLIIPLNDKVLQKTTLGKIPRGKIRKSFENGEFELFRTQNETAVTAQRLQHFEAAANEIEHCIIDIFMDSLGIQGIEYGATDHFFALGITSIDLIRVKTRLEKALGKEDIPMITIISNPTARSLAIALSLLEQPEHAGYNPMVTLQAAGSKTPLWLIHPGVGEVFIFLALSSYFKDRPVYAMRARGFEVGESYFTNTAEIVSTYCSKIKATQPHGPYAIAGYSFGAMLAFEIAKVLQQTDEVKFLGVFNLPPHIKLRMRQLDWTNCLLHLSYFLNFFSEQYAHKMHPILREQSREQVLEHVLSIAPQARMTELGLNAKKLHNWAETAYALQSSAVDYEPSGSVECVDIFCAVPLTEVAQDMDDWIDNHLSKWADFSKTQPAFHRVDGAHYTMISPAHVHTFQRTLKAALEKRGV